MNIPVSILEIDRILGGGPAMPAVADSIVLGMPHLCLGGLSETWLLKECGHRHWFLLAHAAGHAVPDFRDASGEPVYAAFVASRCATASSMPRMSTTNSRSKRDWPGYRVPAS